MLWFEREVVHALMSPGLDDGARRAVEDYVDQTLRAMPEHLRGGVVAESLTLGALTTVRHALGRDDPRRTRELLERWRTSRIDVIRQYVRLLESLVLFGEQELAAETIPL